MAVNMSTTTTGTALPSSVASEIITTVQESSAVMALAQPMELPGTGEQIQIVTGEPTAGWVGESEAAAVSEHTLDNKTLMPYKVAVIEIFSNEFASDLSRLYDLLISRTPAALAKAFDKTVFGGTAVPGSDFDSLSTCSAVSIAADPWSSLVTADAAIAENDGISNGYVIAPAAKSILLTSVDGNKRPLFIDSITANSVPTILGQPVHIAKAAKVAGAPNVIGWVGDWTKAMYGLAGGIKITLDKSATIVNDGVTTNLFQQGMMAVRTEMRAGFRVASTDYFYRLTDAVS